MLRDVSCHTMHTWTVIYWPWHSADFVYICIPLWIMSTRSSVVGISQLVRKHLFVDFFFCTFVACFYWFSIRIKSKIKSRLQTLDYMRTKFDIKFLKVKLFLPFSKKTVDFKFYRLLPITHSLQESDMIAIPQFSFLMIFDEHLKTHDFCIKDIRD